MQGGQDTTFTLSEVAQRGCRLGVQSPETTMDGFSHFDRSHHENFCASVLLLLLDTVPATREPLGELLCRGLGTEGAATLRRWTREVSLVGAAPDDKGRADLALWYETGERTMLVLVEVKTSLNWVPEDVEGQAERYANQRTIGRGEDVDHVVVLAPTLLGDALAAHSVGWFEVLDALKKVREDAGPTAERLLQAAEAHIVRHGAPIADGGGALPRQVNQAIQVVGALNTLVSDAISAIGGTTQGDRPYLSSGGNASSNAGWRYRSVQRKLTWKGKQYWMGIFDYDEAPSTAPEFLGPRLEVYEDDGGAYVIGIPLGIAPLDTGRLRALRKACVEAWEAKHP